MNNFFKIALASKTWGNNLDKKTGASHLVKHNVVDAKILRGKLGGSIWAECRHLWVIQKILLSYPTRARDAECILIIAWGSKIGDLGVGANLTLEGSAYGPCWCHDDGILENGLWADVLNNLPNG